MFSEGGVNNCLGGVATSHGKGSSEVPIFQHTLSKKWSSQRARRWTSPTFQDRVVQMNDCLICNEGNKMFCALSFINLMLKKLKNCCASILAADSYSWSRLCPKIRLCEDGPGPLWQWGGGGGGDGGGGSMGTRDSSTSSSWVSSISEDCRLRLAPWAAPWFFLRIELRDSSVILWIWTVRGRPPRGDGEGIRTREGGASCHITQLEARSTARLSLFLKQRDLKSLFYILDNLTFIRLIRCDVMITH